MTSCFHRFSCFEVMFSTTSSSSKEEFSLNLGTDANFFSQFPLAPQHHPGTTHRPGITASPGARPSPQRQRSRGRRSPAGSRPRLWHHLEAAAPPQQGLSGGGELGGTGMLQPGPLARAQPAGATPQPPRTRPSAGEELLP